MFFEDVNGIITVQPQNTVVVAGTNLILNCTSTNTNTGMGVIDVIWNYVATSRKIVYNPGCTNANAAEFSNLQTYEQTNAQTEECDVLLTAVTSSQAGVFQCQESAYNNPSYAAEVLVLGKY